MHHNILFLQMALYSIVDMDERDQMLTTNCIYKIFMKTCFVLMVFEI